VKTEFASLDDRLELQDGTIASVRIEPDDGLGPPWKEHDGHGVVSDWRRTDSKVPGERILCTDHGHALFYDVQETTKIAKRDGWGCGVEGHDHKTEGERVACAVDQDFDYCRRFANGDWGWVGVVIDLEHDGWEKPHAASLWGIDSDDDAYLLSTANDLLSEALEHNAC
jgi:hypothetical protein